QVERPVGEALPQTLSVAPLTDRRGAFPGRGAVQDLLRGEGQIVRARLGRDWEAGIPGPPEALQRVGRRDMHNVDRAARLATEVQHQLDALELGGSRAGGEIRAIAARVAPARRRPPTGWAGA